MRIGVDCHVLSGKFQGSRTYMANLYQAVLDLRPTHDFIFFGHWREGKFFGEGHDHVDYPSESRWKRLTYQTAPLARRYRLEALHCNYISPLLLPAKSVLTVHDLLFETHPQFFDRSQLLRNKFLIRRSARKAGQIHTVSEFSRQALIDIYRLPEESVFVVPDGVDLKKFSPGDKRSAAARVFEKYRIRDYVLSVGRLEPRKNHVNLLRAYALLKSRKEEVGPLVFVGQKDFGFHELFEMISKLGLDKDVRILERVDDAVLPDVYRAARIFVYPSYAEGFGIPPLEAMACEIPVVASCASAIREVTGDACLHVNPASSEDIAQAMHAIISDQSLADELSRKGGKQAKMWTWGKAAEKYLNAVAMME
ncbi:MAG TPA: glycosyltransferase family 1 protein [Burkholderiales bacterium]|nr:glycosyltransferase family 1 protein [Burkholderiales bacterium]